MEQNTAGRRFAGSMGARIDAALRDTRKRLERRRVYRATLAELRRLSARDLADLGLTKKMLRSLAREAAERA